MRTMSLNLEKFLYVLDIVKVLMARQVIVDFMSNIKVHVDEQLKIIAF